MPDVIVTTDGGTPITVTTDGTDPVTVNNGTNVAIIDVATTGPRGATGLPGEPGEDGEGRNSYEHPVMIPDDDYIITHNEGIDPAHVGFTQAGIAYGIYWEIVTPGVSIRVTHGQPMTGMVKAVF